jgi:predicted phosphoribosyltransferase
MGTLEEMSYRNRTHAGHVLAAAVSQAVDVDVQYVLGIPRGGVIVALPVAEALGATLDVAVARKIGAPNQRELAIGAVTADGPAFLNSALIDRLSVTDEYLDAEIAAARVEARRREQLYRLELPPPAFADHTVVVVDDGVATGATLIAVLRMVVAAAGRVVVAVPVGPRDTLEALRREAADVVCPLVPRWFAAVGEWYDDFRQTTDEEVLTTLSG